MRLDTFNSLLIEASIQLMTELRICPIPTSIAASFWSGSTDAYGMQPERRVSDGKGIPCRHCLSEVSQGESYLTLAYCPFPESQPYAETGPIFLHASPCAMYSDTKTVPAMFLSGEPRIVRGYDSGNRIIYGTGKVVPPDNIMTYASDLLKNSSTHYIHIRSSNNNCFSFRIDRAG